MADHTPVLEVQNLAIGYRTRQGIVRAVRDISFTLDTGETLGLVGESGSGKSTVAFALVGYLGRTGSVLSGDIRFLGQSLVGRSPRELRQLRGNRISMVFQNPMTSLNPVLTIGDQMSEVLIVHRKVTKEEAYERCRAMLERVYMPDPAAILERYPHQISGGQQQRVLIAMALLNNPALLVMDEPTTALDVTVEAAVLDLVADLRRDFDTAILFISHNLGIIARISQQVGVMYAGELVEYAPVRELFANPRHPYTQGLLRSIPRLGRTKLDSPLYPIPGQVPAPANLPPGCTFTPRCPHARDECVAAPPDYRRLTGHTNHFTRCLFSEEIDLHTWEPPTDGVFRPNGDSTASTADPLLNLTDLRTYYSPSGGINLLGLGDRNPIRAVDGVSFSLRPGTTLGVVGESGSGKSTLVKAIIGLEDVTSGEAAFMGFDLSQKVQQRDLSIISELQMVFQNPDATMNPNYTVGQQLARPLRRFNIVPKDQVEAEVNRLLHAVRLDESYRNRYPRQLSGGEKQRIGIARAFAARPDLVLADEPVSALDVSVQAAVINLLLDIQHRYGTAMIFIAHDLSVVRYLADYVAVMYLGKLVEIGPADAIYRPPYHPYTESLLAAIPIPDPTVTVDAIRLEGSVPSPANPPSGCRFHTRCPRRNLMPDGGLLCETTEPPLVAAGPEHTIACHLPLDTLRNLPPVFHTEANS